MSTIDAVFEKWQEDCWERSEPEEILEAYAEFRRTIQGLSGSLSQDIWDAMTVCMSRAQEYGFKEGYKAGYWFHDEVR